MKKHGFKKPLIIILCCFCLVLLFSPVTYGFSDALYISASKPVTSGRLPDLAELFNQVNESRLRMYVDDIQGFGPHPTGSQAIIALRDYLYVRFSAMNLSVRFDPWQEKQRSGDNIVATLEGTAASDTAVLLCAHYDSLAISPGAEDDGSGVASVLMIADIMRQYSFNTTVLFVLFSGEEQGLLGSRSYAQNASAHHQNILGVLALDKVGYAVTSEEGASLQHHSNPSSAWMVTLSSMIATRYPDEIGLRVVSLPEDPQSDHHSFTEEGCAGTDFVRNAANPFYHTSEDLAEHMNFSYLTKVCKLALGTVVSMASLHPQVSHDDLKITMKGTRLSPSAQFSVKVENTNITGDTANVTITIVLRHLLRKSDVHTIKQGVRTPCNWTIDKEIEDSWEFIVTGRKFTRCFFIMEVTLTGRGDDIYLYSSQKTYGVIISPFRLVMIPRL
jgi:hypothetical protein